ncbi:MAG: ATP-binding cassette domain-containing protein [Clostridia bacterium]|nr:ATP-binding cassette domain-containing protein [Clostridia bacterium]
METVNNALEIINLSKNYGANKAVDNISFNVKHGEIMGFLGPNGAGKSTTMNIICGCISASGGTVNVCGCDVLENPKIVKSKIGYLPENPPLYFDMKVWEYLSFVYDLKKVKNNKKEHIEKIMELVKISDMKNRMIKNLSKGYKQRVGLAQALIGDPEVLILDEPTVGLDPKQIIEIRNVIKEIGKERTIILSTHILQEVSAVCDRVTIISHGKIVAQNTLKGLEEATGGKDKYILKLKGDTQKALDILSSIDEIVNINTTFINDSEAEILLERKPESDISMQLTEAFGKNGIAITEFKSALLTLEEIFIKLTNSKIYEEEKEEQEVTENDSNI